MPKKKGWLEKSLKDPVFRKYLAREDLIEDYFSAIEKHMKKQKVSMAVLAYKLGYKVSTVDHILCRKVVLTANDMSDIAFHLGLQLKISVTKRKGKS